MGRAALGWGEPGLGAQGLGASRRGDERLGGHRSVRALAHRHPRHVPLQLPGGHRQVRRDGLGGEGRAGRGGRRSGAAPGKGRPHPGPLTGAEPGCSDSGPGPFHHPERVPALPCAAAPGRRCRSGRGAARTGPPGPRGSARSALGPAASPGSGPGIREQIPVLFQSQCEISAAPELCRAQAARGHPQPASVTGNDRVPSPCQKPGSQHKLQL